jgi:hypothetical protein
MPFEPPDPGKILDALRAVEAQLRALAAAHPHDPLPKLAVGAVEVAEGAVQAMADRGAPTAAG